jgi:hypothetical protein
MAQLQQDRVNKLLVIFLVILAGFLVYVWRGVAAPAKRQANMIHEYLGYNHDDDSTQWRGLTGEIKRANLYVKDKFNDLSTDLCRLRTPQGECPPGGPAGSPVAPPNYPP